MFVTRQVLSQTLTFGEELNVASEILSYQQCPIGNKIEKRKGEERERERERVEDTEKKRGTERKAGKQREKKVRAGNKKAL